MFDTFIPAEAYRNAAFERWHKDGEIEIDDPSNDDFEGMISRGDDPGAYVRAWVWIPEEDIPAEKRVPEAEMPSPRLSTRSFLDLSTSHITEATSQTLAVDINVFQRDTGFVVWVPETAEQRSRYSAELQLILETALGIADYVMFDADGPIDDRFQVYHW